MKYLSWSSAFISGCKHLNANGYGVTYPLFFSSSFLSVVFGCFFVIIIQVHLYNVVFIPVFANTYYFPLFSFCSFSPISASLDRVEVEGFAFCPDPFSLHCSPSAHPPKWNVTKSRSPRRYATAWTASRVILLNKSINVLLLLCFLFCLFSWHCCAQTPRLRG